MSRSQRIHIERGIYLVEQTSTQPPIFEDSTDYVTLSEQIPAAMRTGHVRIHAFCLLPTAFYFAVQVGDLPLSRFMTYLLTLYMHSFNQRHGLHGSRPRPRYRALLIEPQAYFLRLIRYLHWLPTLKQIADHNSYPWSSHPSYLCRAHTPWLTTTMTLRLLAFRKETAQHAYLDLMSRPPRISDIEGFEHGLPHEPRVLARPLFLRKLPSARPYRSTKSLDEVIQLVAMNRQISAKDMLSKIKRHDLALARALVTWYATEHRIASLSAVARCFGYTPSTLHANLRQYQQRNPELFSMHTLPVPAEPIGHVISTSTPDPDILELEDSAFGMIE